MDISIVICTYNRCNSLKRTLDSVVNMDVPDTIKWETIVVDNNSSDGTQDIVESFQNRNELIVRYVSECKQGLSYARNRGILEAFGSIIVFTDDDVIVDKNWIKYIYNDFIKYDPACLGGKIVPEWEIPPPRWLIPKLYGYLAILDDLEESGFISNPDNIYGANMSFCLNIFKKYGNFNPNLGRIGYTLYGGEETDMINRLITQGEKVMISPISVVKHCITKDRMTKKYFRKWRKDQSYLAGMMSCDKYSKNMFGIPLYIIKNTIVSFMKYTFMLIIGSRNYFCEELKIIHGISYVHGVLYSKMHKT